MTALCVLLFGSVRVRPSRRRVRTVRPGQRSVRVSLRSERPALRPLPDRVLGLPAVSPLRVSRPVGRVRRGDGGVSELQGAQHRGPLPQVRTAEPHH